MERLYLKWKDINNKSYTIATLYKYDGYYYLMIHKEALKEAMDNGCVGIGNLNIKEAGYKSKDLFSFFKNRIPNRDNEFIDKFLKENNLKEYNEMKILKKTKGILGTDRYYLE